ncbi:MAG: 5,10-methylenetetrahydrofolate reductase, partial [uncultured Nocardioidaceae bacterium]
AQQTARRAPQQPGPRRPLRGAADAHRGAEGARAPADRPHRDGDSVPRQGLGRHPRPVRAAGQAGLHGRPAPRGADGPRPQSARRDRRPADDRRRPLRVRPRGGQDAAGGAVRRRAGAAGGPDRAGTAVRGGRHHRLPRDPPVAERRRRRAGDVGQAPPRHEHREQPRLRPGCHGRVAAADADARDHAAGVARDPGTRRARQAARDGDEDRRRRLHEVPHQAQARDAAAGGAGRVHRGALPRGLRARALTARRRCRRAPRLHLQPGRRDRAVAHDAARADAGHRPSTL